MTRATRFVLLALAGTVALVAPPAASAVVASPGAASGPAQETQTFTGSGSGTTHHMPHLLPVTDGHYSSTGQLGSGIFDIDSTFSTVTFFRSGGTLLDGSMARSTECDPVIVANGDCRAADLTGGGNDDIASAHVVISLAHRPTGDTVSFFMRGTLVLRHRIGYVMLGSTGHTYAFGGIDHLGDAPTSNAVDIARTPSGRGYWVVNTVGQVYAFGDARYLGGADASASLPGHHVTSISPTPTGNGYWLFTVDGRALRFGDARLFGDMHLTPLNGGIVDSVATPTGNGYYMVGRDGGVFAFGDARFRGSTGGLRLNAPVVGLVPTPGNDGYWLVAADGGAFSFRAPFRGSMGGTPLNRPVVAMVGQDTGYLMVGSDGGVFDFARAPFFGSLGGGTVPAPIVSGAAIG